MKTKILLFMILLLLPLTSHSQSSEDRCPPPSNSSSPGGDQPDDNFSFSKGIFQIPGKTNILIFMNGFFNETNSILNGTYFELPESAASLLKVSSVLVIPSGGLFGKENVLSVKVLLGEYVRIGGTLIIFSQQYGKHIVSIVPIPEGELIKSYGWREDQSCLKNSVYFDSNSMHAVLSSSTNQQIDAGVDGYFSSYPSGSTILLKRQTNREPALLYYHYGNGTVILTSMFTDWAYSHSQASTTELNLVRDLITFAKNPKLPIAMFNFTNNPNPSVNLNVNVTNNTEEPASRTKLFVYTPDRKTLLYETEAAVNINREENVEVPIAFTLPILESKDYGICHTFYELYDTDNHLVQMETESDGGRFAIYQTPEPYVSKNDVDMWLTAESEYVYWDDKPNVTIHIKNNSNEEKTNCSLGYDWWHHDKTGIPGTFNLAAGESKTVTFEPSLKLIYNHRAAMEGLWVDLRYYDNKARYPDAGKPFPKGGIV